VFGLIVGLSTMNAQAVLANRHKPTAKRFLYWVYPRHQTTL
jgi:hypothetical protein